MNRPRPKRPFEHVRRPLPCPAPNWGEVYRELGLGVTICIAATTDEGAIVTVSDRMISFGNDVQAPDNAALKALQISQRWGVLYTADDVSPVFPLVRNVRNRLRDIKNDPILKGLDTINLSLVKKVICQEYTAIFHQQVVERFLLKYGFSELQQFREIGLQQFGETKFLSILEEIDKFDLGVGLLVYGFDPVRTPLNKPVTLLRTRSRLAEPAKSRSRQWRMESGRWSELGRTAAKASAWVR